MAMTILRTSLIVTTNMIETLTGIGRALLMRRNSTVTLAGLMTSPWQGRHISPAEL